jgi:hypothetical protein
VKIEAKQGVTNLSAFCASHIGKKVKRPRGLRSNCGPGSYSKNIFIERTHETTVRLPRVNLHWSNDRRRGWRFSIRWQHEQKFSNTVTTHIAIHWLKMSIPMFNTAGVKGGTTTNSHMGHWHIYWKQKTSSPNRKLKRAHQTTEGSSSTNQTVEGRGDTLRLEEQSNKSLIPYH